MLSSHLPIATADLKKFEQSVQSMLERVHWIPAIDIDAILQEQLSPVQQKTTKPAYMKSTTVGGSKPQTVSLMAITHDIAKDNLLLPESLNKMLLVIRTGLCLGYYMGVTYGKASGLDVLESQNKTTVGLGPNQLEQFQEKYNTMTAIGMFCAASYVVWALGSYETGKVSADKIPFFGIPELPLEDPDTAFTALLYTLCRYQLRIAHTQYQMVSVTLRFFEEVIKEILLRKNGLKHTKAFADVAYQLEESGFTIQGFEPLKGSGYKQVEIEEVRFNETVGNKEAKFIGLRGIKQLLCYDPRVQMNPVVKLGGFQQIRVFPGTPGCGKTQNAKAIATELMGRAAMIGDRYGLRARAFLFPNNLVDTFQGGSGKHTDDAFDILFDPTWITAGYMDDAEQNLRDRTLTGISAGTLEVVSTVLVRTEGMGSIIRGHWIFDILSNHLEMVDPAILSRAQGRYPMNGPESPEDFMDMIYLWTLKFADGLESLGGFNPPKNYNFLSAQQPLRSLSELNTTLVKPVDKDILKIYEDLESDKLTYQDFDFWGPCLSRIRAHPRFKKFSGRDLRNILQAVAARFMDFDIPDEWFEHPDRFFYKDYAEKYEILKRFRNENMKGLNIPEVFQQEAVRYLNILATVQDTERERDVERRVKSIEVEYEANRRWKQSLN